MTTTNKWVKNMSSIPLMKAQEHLLAYEPKFAITLKCPANGEYITAVEPACPKCTMWEADKLSAEVKTALKKTQPQDPTSIGEKGRH